MMHRCLRAGAVLAASMVMLVGFGGAGTQKVTQTVTASQQADETVRLLQKIPPALQSVYENAGFPMRPSVYANLAAASRPWQLCFSDHFTGNPFHARIIAALKRMNMQLAEAGYTTRELIVTDANHSVPTQVSQIQSMIDRHCSAIMAILASPNGFVSVLKAAYDHGIPFVSGAGVPNSPYSENVLNNFYVMGQTLAQGLVDRLGGKGNIVMVEGVPGSFDVELQKKGALSVFQKYPGIKIVADVYGKWTPSVVKSVMLEVLATHPEQIDGVWTTGQSFAAVGDAFLQTHRPLPKVITGTGSGHGLGWWHEHRDQVHGFDVAQEPDPLAQQMFRVAVRLLMGEHPIVNNLIEPLPVITDENLDQWWKPCMTPSNTSAFPVPPEDPWPTDILDRLFTNGQEIPGYDYHKWTLPPCGY